MSAISSSTASTASGSAAAAAAEQSPFPPLHFRNYIPVSARLKSLPRKTRPTLLPALAAQRLLAAAKHEARRPPRDDEPVLIAPKRANWDLKRDCEKRLKRLEKETLKAIATLAKTLGGDSSDSES